MVRFLVGPSPIDPPMRNENPRGVYLQLAIGCRADSDSRFSVEGFDECISVDVNEEDLDKDFVFTVPWAC